MATVIEFKSPLTIAPCNKQLNSLFPSSIIKKKKSYFKLPSSEHRILCRPNGSQQWIYSRLKCAAPPLQLKPSEMYTGLVCDVCLLSAIFGSPRFILCWSLIQRHASNICCLLLRVINEQSALSVLHLNPYSVI